MPEATVTPFGVTATVIGGGAGAVTATLAVPTTEGFATLVAVIVAVTPELFWGAVYRPVGEIHPTLACQDTDVLVA